MEAKELEKLHWRHLSREEWMECEKHLTSRAILVFGEDIDSFVDNLIQNICIKANIRYCEAEAVFVNKNVVFYALKNNLFTPNTNWCQVWDTLMMNVLCQLLEVPDFSEVDKRKKRRIFRKESRRKPRRKSKRKR